jgi:hypothetical protein
MRVLDWQENLEEEYMPPRWMWIFEDELQQWFEEVDRDRRRKYNLNSSEDSSEPMVGNELAERFRK